MARHKKMNYWSTSDVRFLKNKAGKMHIRNIAHHLGRTEGATRQKAWAMGISTASQ